MSNQNISVHEFDVNLISEFFSNLERQGPGSSKSTIKALSFIDNLTKDSHIADLGCGTGAQTMTLLQHIECKITAVDIFPLFIEKLTCNAKKFHVDDRVKVVVGSMDNLSFCDEELDLIWCEGAIYNIGFQRGFNEWRRFLKNGGYIAVTEASWFTDKRPEEINSFWMDAYPEIDTIPNKVAQMQAAGYIPVATFIIPDNCWTDNYYIPQIPAHKMFLEKYAGNKTVEKLVSSQKYEAELYSKYKKYYGYVFYIGKKID